MPHSRQARWALLFTRFRFTLSYRPGSKNLKPDALSRQFPSSSEDRPLGSIILRPLILVLVSWGIETVVMEAQGRETVPDGCLTDFLFLLRHGPRYFSGLTRHVSALI